MVHGEGEFVEPISYFQEPGWCLKPEERVSLHKDCSLEETGDIRVPAGMASGQKRRLTLAVTDTSWRVSFVMS